MIITYPTGFYDLSDSKSVTFLISNTTPPRSGLTYPKIPQGIVNRKRFAPRVDGSGDLVFSVSKSSRGIANNAARQYETGQILSFEDSIVSSVSPMRVSDITETQHNLNRYDYNSMGVDESEVSLLGNLSYDVKVALENKLNDLKRLRADSEVVINTQQKLINEIDRNIDALDIIISEDSNEGIINLMEKLKNKRDLAYTTRDSAINDANVHAAEADLIVDKLRSIAMVVK